MTDRLLTPRDAAQILGVKPRSLMRFRQEWGIPFVRIGLLVRFRESTLLRWIEENEHGGEFTRSKQRRSL